MLLVRDYQNKSSLAFLVEYDLEKDMTIILQKIYEQLDELAASDFVFVACDCPITKAQEKNYLAKHCVEQSQMNDGFSYELFIKVIKDENSQNEFPQKDREEPTATPIQKAKQSEKSIPRIKRYTDEMVHDFTTTTLLESERRTFWNRKADEIDNDPSLSEWGVQALEGVIDVSWTMKKTELLNLRVEKIQTLNINNIREDSTMWRSLGKNLDLLKKCIVMSWTATEIYHSYSQMVKYRNSKWRTTLIKCIRR